MAIERLEDRLAPATYIWSGAGANNNWSTAANWVSGNAPTGSSSALDSLVFPAGASQLTSVNNLTSATFDRITISGSGYTLTGNRLTLGDPSVVGSGSIFVNAGVTNDRIQLDIQLGAATGTKQFFTVNAGADLDIQGSISSLASAELTKQGTGLLILSANNSGMTGPITIDSNSGVMAITNPNALGTTTAVTTVGTNSQLQLRVGAGTINEPLILNGPGLINDGALLNSSGNNTWAGTVFLDSDSTFGAAVGTSVNITGVISDLGAGHNVVKEGQGNVIFSAANSYRGLTTINDGQLTIRNALGLGVGGTAQNGTLVNQNITKSGALQIEGSFVVFNEELVINGTGGGAGSLREIAGNSEWAGGITLGSPSPNGVAPSIGASGGASLLVSGVVTKRQPVNVANLPLPLTKVGAGKLIFSNANTYDATTTVSAGTLTIRDSRALSIQTVLERPANSGIVVIDTPRPSAVLVANGATLELEIDSGLSPHGRDLADDSTTGVFNKLIPWNPLLINGRGVNNVGALRNVSGINVIDSPPPMDFDGNGTIDNVTTITINSAGTAGGQAAIGVEPDANPSNTNLYFINDWSLTIPVRILEPVGLNDPITRVPSTLSKRGAGHLILDNNTNDYSNQTLIEEGWITIKEGGALGIPRRMNAPPGLTLSDSTQPQVIVSAGASLHLKPDVGQNVVLTRRLVLEGTGITHPFALISRKGALMNLGGDNVVGGIETTGRRTDIQLRNQAGIGVELPDSTYTNSSLTITSPISDFPGSNGGIVKLGSRLLSLQGEGNYSGNNVVDEGVLRVQHDTALGTASTGTTATGNNGYSSTTTTVSRGIRELQSILVAGTPGTYTLTFDGQTTGPIPFTATAAEVALNLNNLPSILNVGGSVTVTQSGNLYIVSFGGTFRGFNQPQLIANATGGPIITVNTIMDGDGAALELGSTVPWINGGLSSGVNVWYETVSLNSPGNLSFDDAPLTVLGNDNMWRGAMNLVDDGTVKVLTGARLTVFGGVTDAGAPTISGSDITLIGGGKLALGGNGTFRGTTNVREGTLVLENSQALGSTGISEVQTVSLTGFSLGTFTLTFNGATTPILPFVAPAPQVEAALNALSSATAVGGIFRVSRTNDVFTITFDGSFFAFDQPDLVAVGASGAVATQVTVTNGAGGTQVFEGAGIQLQGSLAVAGEPLIMTGRGGTDFGTVQRVTPSGLTTGSFQLSFNGEQTVPIPFNSSGAFLRTALNNLGTIGGAGGTVDVTGIGVPTVQTVQVAGGAPFTLSFDGSTTASIPNNSPPAVVEAELNALLSVNGVKGSVSVTGTGNNYTVVFAGTLGIGQISLMTGSANVTVVETTRGSVSYYDVRFADGFFGTPQPLMEATGSGGTNAVVATFTNVPLSWFNEGPAPINNGQTPGNNAVTGRITGVVTDPTDPNVIFVSTAAGGVWKSLNSGRTWSKTFDLRAGVNEVQQVIVTGAGGTFTMAFNGAVTEALPNGASARQVQEALNNLTTIGGVYASVVVSEAGGVYTVTFSGGTLASTDVPQLDAEGFNGADAFALVVGDGVASNAAMYIGSITMDSTKALYIGTGEANQSSEAFYGTGIYRSANQGINWTLVTGTQVQTVSVRGSGQFNVRFKGQTTSSLTMGLQTGPTEAQVDTAFEALAAAGAGSVQVSRLPLSETQHVQITALNGGMYTLTFNGATTAALNVTDNADVVAAALNALATIGGVRGVVVVTNFSSANGIINYDVTWYGQPTVGQFDQPMLIGTNVSTGTPPPAVTFNITETLAGGMAYQIRMTGALASADQPPVVFNVASGANLSGFASITQEWNPHLGRAVSRVMVDPNDPQAIIAATGDTAGTGLNEIQAIKVGVDQGTTFRLIFQGKDASGQLMSLRTAAITNSGFGAATATAIQNAINVLPTMGTTASPFGGVQVAADAASQTYLVTFGLPATFPNPAPPPATVPNQYAFTNVPQMVAEPSDLVTIVTNQDGRPAVTRSETQNLVLGTGVGGTFTLTFTGQDATGAVVTLTTAPITVSASATVTAANIQTALNALANIGGIGGAVSVSTTFAITFGGTLANTNVAELLPTPGPNTNFIVTTPAGDGRGVRDVNGAAGNAGTWRLRPWASEFRIIANGTQGTFTLRTTGDPLFGTQTSAAVAYNATADAVQAAINNMLSIALRGARAFVSLVAGGKFYSVTFFGALDKSILPFSFEAVGAGGCTASTNEVTRGGINSWFNMTDVVSQNRIDQSSTQAQTPTPYNNPTPAVPRTAGPGPDDDYRVRFNSTNSVWSDVALVYTDITNPTVGSNPIYPVIYAAQGTPSGGSIANGQTNPFNGVFWTRNPYSNTIIWYEGAPGGTNASPATAPTGVDNRPTGFPIGRFQDVTTTPLQTQARENAGYIKLAAVAGPTLITTSVFATVASPYGTFVGGTNNGGGNGGLFRSTDGGHTWTQLAGSGGNSPLTDFLNSQGSFAIAVVAQDANNVFVGGSPVNPAAQTQMISSSTDAGLSWADISILAGAGPRNGVHALYLDQDLTNPGTPRRLLVATDGGLWRRTTAGTWENLNGDLSITQVNGVASHPTDLSKLVIGTQRNGIATFNNNLNWTSTDGFTGGQVRMDQTNPNIVYAVRQMAGQNAVLRKSTDGGQTWVTIDAATPPFISTPTFPLVMDAINNSRLLYARAAQLRETVDQGLTWSSIGINLPAAFGTITGIAVAGFQGPFAPDTAFPLVVDRGSSIYDPDTIYVTNGSTIQVTKNHGVTWAARTGTLAGLGSLYDIQVDPRNRDTIYAVRNAVGGPKVFRSTDAGLNWTNITADLPDLPVWKLVLDARTSDLYVGTDRGVYMLQGGLVSAGWKEFGSGMSNVQVRDLDLNETTNTLRAGTYGRGVFLLYLDDNLQNVGALRATSGASTWTGPVYLVGDTIANRAYVSANGTKSLENGIATASLDISGRITDLFVNNDTRLVKVGLGDVILSGSNTYGGITEIREGSLLVQNARALGTSDAETIVNAGTSLELFSDLELEPVTLNGDGILFNGHFTGALRNVANNNTYTGTATLATNATIGVDTGSTLTVGTKSPTLQGTGTITDAGAGFKLTKELTGTLILASQNTYAGATDIVAGAIQVRHNQALGTTAGGTTVYDGGQLQMQSPAGGPPVVVSGEALFLSGSGIDSTGALLNTGGNNTWQGPVTLISKPNYSPTSGPLGAVSFGVSAAGDTLTIDGVIDEGTVTVVPSGLTKVGPGALSLKQANTYSGTTYVKAGSVRIQNNSGLGTTNNKEIQRVTLSSLNTTTGTFTLTYNGSSTAAMGINSSAAVVQGQLATILPVGVTATVARVTVTSGLPTSLVSSNVYTITFTTNPAAQDVPQLLLTLSGGAAGFISTVADGGLGTIVSSGAALELDGASAPGGVITLAGETIALNGTGIGGNGALRNLSGSNTLNGAIVLQSNTSIGAAAGSQVLLTGQVQDPVAQQFFTPIIPAPVPAASLTKVGTGTVAFGVANPYGGRTLVNQGVLNIRNAGSLGTTGPEIQTITVAATGTVGTFRLTFNGQTTAPLAYNVPASGGTGPTASVQNALNALASIGGVGGSVTVTQSANVFTVTFGGTLAIGNQPQITGVGFNGVTLTLATFRDGPEGTVVASGATLQVQGGITVSTEDLTLNGPGFNNAGALENANTGAANNNTWNRAILLGSSSAIGVSRAGDTLTIQQSINQAAAGFAVAKVGPGTLRYSGAAGTSNTYTGTTTVADGTLELNKTGGAVAVGAGFIIGDTVGAAGTATARWLQPDQVVDSAVVTVNSDGLLDLNGLAETIATLNVLDGQARTGVNGTLTVTNVNMAGGTINLGAGGQVRLNGASATFTATSSLLSEALIQGPGTLNLNGFTRTLTVNDGPQPTDLHLDAASVVSGGAVGLIKQGAGRLEMDGAITYTNPTQILAGDVQVDGTIGDVLLNGGSLSGVGTVGTVAGGSPAVGTVAPGDNGVGATGILHSGAAQFGPQTTFQVNLNNPTLGTGYDQLQVNGNIDLGGANLQAIIGLGVSVGQTYTIVQTINGGTVTGQFAQGTVTFINGRKYTIQYFTDHVDITRIKAEVIMTAASSVNPSVYGEPVTFTVTVASESGASVVPSMTQVRFTLDSTFVQVQNVASGTLTLDPQALIGGPLSVGAHTLLAEFLGDVDFNNGSVTLTPPQQVNKSPTAIDVSSVPLTLVTGQSLQVKAHVKAVPPGGTVAGSAIPTGTVVFTIDGTAYPAAGLDGNSDGFLPLPSGLGTGIHAVRVSYSGNGNYAVVTTPSDYFIVVDKANTSLVVGVPPTSLARGNPMTFTATVSAVAPGSGFPRGEVSFYYDTVSPTNLIGTADLNGAGVAMYVSNTVPAGAHSIFAVYAGNADYIGSQNSASYTVLPGVTTTALTSSKPAGSVFGETVTFEATVTSNLPVNGIPTGQVIFKVDGVAQPAVTLNQLGKATFTTSALAVGGRTITADYFDPTTPDINDQFGPSSATLTQNVGKANTSFSSLLGTPTVSVSGQVVTFRAVIVTTAPGSGVPTGTVTFFVNGVDKGTANLVNNLATLPIAFLTAGTFNVTATYNGSGDYNTTSLTVPRVINKADTTTSVAANPAAPVAGQTVTLTAQVTPVAPGATAPGSFTPSGQVVFTVDGAQRPAVNVGPTGAGSINVTGLQAGLHRVSVQYLGDANYNLSMTPTDFLFTVAKASTNVAVGVPSTPIARGNPMTFTATVSAASPGSGTPTGVLSFYFNTVSPTNLIGQSLLSNGVGTISTSTLPAGPLTIFAVYAGDANYLSKTDSAAYTVLPAVTTLTLTSNLASALFGQPITFDANVQSAIPANGIPVGEVVFKVDGVAQVPSVTVDPIGHARLTLTTLAVGSRVITAEYVDTTTPDTNDQFAGSMTTMTQAVVKADTLTTLNLINPTAVAGQTVEFQATVDAVAPGAGSPDGLVTFLVNGAPRGQAPITGGVASFSLLFATQGTFNVTAQYVGSGSFNTSTSASQPQKVVPYASQTGISQSVAQSAFGQAVTFTATVRGGPLNGAKTQVPPGTVTFLIDGVARPAIALNGNGQAALTLGLGVGPHAVQARYNGAVQYAGSVSGSIPHNTVRATTKTTISTNRNPSYVGQNTVVTATITAVAPGGGVPGGTVTFFVDGVIRQDVTVNGSGVASLSLGALTLGNHVIAAQYSGSGNYVNSAAAMNQTMSNPTRITGQLIGSPLPIGNPFTLRVYAVGADGSVAPGFNAPVSFAILSAPAGGTVTGPRNSNFVNGVGDFTGLRLTRTGVYVLRVISGSLFVDLTIDIQGRLA